MNPSGYCSAFVGDDSEGDSCIYVVVYDAEGNRLRCLTTSELEQLLGGIDKATATLFPDLWK